MQPTAQAVGLKPEIAASPEGGERKDRDSRSVV